MSPTAPGSLALSLCPIPVPRPCAHTSQGAAGIIQGFHPSPMALPPASWAVFVPGSLWDGDALGSHSSALVALAPVRSVPRNEVLEQLLPLGNASSAALAVIWLQFGPGDLGQVTDKGPASPLAAGADPAVGVPWCGAGMLLGTPGMQEESAGFGGFRGKEEVFWMNTGVMPTCSWALSVAEPGGGSGLKENLCQGSSAASPGSGRGWVGRWRSGHPAPHTPRFGGG